MCKVIDIIWCVLFSVNLNQIFVVKFFQVGYDVIEVVMVEIVGFKIVVIEVDYKFGNDLQLQILCVIVVGMKEYQIFYIVLGMLDVGLVEKDLQSGLQCVVVIVNVKVWDVIKFIFCICVVVGLVVYVGVGLIEEEVCGNVFKVVVSNVVQELLSCMVIMGLQ